MAIVTLKELKAALPRGKRLLGIDHSKKKWGVAVANPDLTIATPLTTIVCGQFSQDIKKISALCKEYEAAGFIIGLPLNMDGSEGPRVDSVRHFALNLMAAKAELGFEPVIAFFDERLSTHAVDDLLDEYANLSRKRRDEVIDKLAAQLILQGALEEMKKG